MRGLITVRHEPRLSSLLGVSVFRQRNTGTHPNTHCCHAVLDVLFICWIPAQSRFSTGAESPTKYAASFALACPKTAHPLRACRTLGSAPIPTAFFVAGSLFCFFSSTPPRISPTDLSFLYPRLLFRTPSRLFSGFLPLFSFPVPLSSLLPLSLFSVLQLSVSLPRLSTPCLCSAARG